MQFDYWLHRHAIKRPYRGSRKYKRVQGIQLEWLCKALFDIETYKLYTDMFGKKNLSKLTQEEFDVFTRELNQQHQFTHQEKTATDGIFTRFTRAWAKLGSML